MVEEWRVDGEGWHNTHFMPRAEAHIRQMNDGDWWMDLDLDDIHLSGRAPGLDMARRFFIFCVREGLGL